MATATNKWTRAVWRNEIQKEQTSLKKEKEKTTRKVEVAVSFDEGTVTISEESYIEWKVGWKKLKKTINEKQKRNTEQRLAVEKLPK